MNLRFGIALIILLLSAESMAQFDSLLIGTMQVHAIPLPWIDKNPRLRLGLEYHGHHHKSYSVELGIGNSFLHHARLERSVWGQAYSFFEVRPEVKWFMKSDKGQFWWGWPARSLPRYIAVEGFYQEMFDILERSDFQLKESELYIAYRETIFKKTKIGLQVKMGFKLPISKRFVMDFYHGIGVAYRKISYVNVINPVVFTEPIPSPFVRITPYKNQGAYYLLQLSWGFRIGYIIK